MLCDLCGKETELFRAIIESSELTVCKNCSKYGRVLGYATSFTQKEAQKPKQQIQKHISKEPEEFVVANYSELIRRKREQLNLNQEDFAKLLNERLSIIHKVETEHFELPIATARKFEKILHIKLVEMFKDPDVKVLEQKKQGFTLGDFIKIKDKKKN